MSKANEDSTVVIRDVETISDLRAVETLQTQVWGCADLDVVPLTLLVAGKEVGATLVGAYDGSTLVGFVYGFTGFEDGHVTHHSHMLAVRPEYRNHQLGFRLKLAQRERVLAQGIDRISWTFDPLQSLNAHLNFTKLGVIADCYKINFYGEATSSFLHQIGTDRLWVTWLLESERVRNRLQDSMDGKELKHSRAPALIEVTSGCRPARNDPSAWLGNQELSIEIPGNINALQQDDPGLAVEWREATRWAFTTALDSNYLVADFYHEKRDDYSAGAYLLNRREVGPV